MKLSDIRLTTEDERPDYQERVELLQPTEMEPLPVYLTLRGLFGLPSGDFDEK